MLRSFVVRLRQLVRGRQLAEEFDDELRFHLELEIEHNIARGLSDADARRAAIAAFGGVQRFREETRDARGFAVVDALVRDVRLTVRRLRRAPAFTAGVVGTLAIGLGASAGIGALVYGVTLRPLPYPDPDRLVRVEVSTPGLGITETDNSSGTYVFFRERARSFSELGAYMENEGIGITEGDVPERVTGVLLTPSVLRLLGVVPAAGRLFVDDDARERPVPVMISDELWRRRYGRDPAIAGKHIELNRSSRRIVGVLPKGFDFPTPRAMVYYAEGIDATAAGLRYRGLTVVGRLRSGVTVRDAQAELNALVSHFHERFPELSAEAVRQSGLRPIVQTMRAAIAAPVRSELMLLGMLVAVVLLIATVNVATLCLLRADRLRGEVAVSRALGASRAAVAQRFIVEGCVLALLGGLVAIPVVVLAVSTKLGFTSSQIPRLYDVSLTPGLVAALVGAVLFIGVVLGVMSAVRARSGDAAQALRGTSRGGGSTGWRRLQRTLVAAQIALSLALVLGAGLMSESLVRLRRVNIGFAPNNGVKFTLQLPFNPYSTNQRAADFHLTLVGALRALPGVTAAGTAMQFPLTEQLLTVHPRFEAEHDDGSRAEVTVNENIASAGFFSVMGIPIRAGRSFEPGDLRSETPGIVISATVARDLFGTADPIGRTVRSLLRKDRPSYRVIGVAGDVYAGRIADGPQPVIYYPLLDEVPVGPEELRIPYVPAGMHFVVRTKEPLPTLVPSLHRAVASIDSRVPVWDVRTLDDIVAESTARFRLTMLLLSVAAGATLALAAVGLYSVIAYSVAGRSSEFAVRQAVGATPAAIVGLVLREGVVLSIAGAAAGVGLALAGSHLISGLLYEVSATDPTTYAGAAVVVVCASIAAMYPPARRAGNSDPSSALRGV
jgi:putative ABC transport system permease protein